MSAKDISQNMISSENQNINESKRSAEDDDASLQEEAKRRKKEEDEAEIQSEVVLVEAQTSTLQLEKPATFEVAALDDPEVKRLIGELSLGELPKGSFSKAFEAVHLDPRASRSTFLGTYIIKFLYTLESFIDQPNQNEGDLTKTVVRRCGQNQLASRSRGVGLDQLLVRLDSSYSETSEIPFKVLVIFARALIGIAGQSRDYIYTASVCAGIFGTFTVNFASWDLVLAQYSVTNTSRNIVLNLKRVSDLGDLARLEREISYNFQDRRLLEDALSQAKSKSSEQGLRCQRLEFLGDALLNLLVAEFWLDIHPESPSNELNYSHQASINRKVLNVTALHIGLDQVIHYGSGSTRRKIGNFSKEIQVIEAEILEKGCPGGEYWKDTMNNKLLCNSYESVLGAVYVDSHLCLNTARGVFDRSIRPILEDHLLDIN